MREPRKLLQDLRNVLKQRGQFRQERFESAEPEELLKDIAVFIDGKYHEWVKTQDAGSPDDPIDHNGGDVPPDQSSEYPEEPVTLPEEPVEVVDEGEDENEQVVS